MHLLILSLNVKDIFFIHFGAIRYKSNGLFSSFIKTILKVPVSSSLNFLSHYVWSLQYIVRSSPKAREILGRIDSRFAAFHFLKSWQCHLTVFTTSNGKDRENTLQKIKSTGSRHAKRSFQVSQKFPNGAACGKKSVQVHCLII